MNELRVTGSLPEKPEPIVVDMSNKHHQITPAHADQVEAYLKAHPAASPVETIEQPVRRDELAEIAASPVDQDPSRHGGEYVELIGRHEKAVHDIAHSEPKVRTHGYALLFFGIVSAFIYSDLPGILRVIAYLVCAAMIGIGIGLLMTRVKAVAVWLMIATLGLEIAAGFLVTRNPLTALAGILVLIMLGYTIATIRDVNDVA